MPVETLDEERQESQSPADAGQQYIESVKTGEALDPTMVAGMGDVASAGFGLGIGELVGVKVGNMSVNPESE